MEIVVTYIYIAPRYSNGRY